MKSQFFGKVIEHCLNIENRSYYNNFGELKYSPVMVVRPILLEKNILIRDEWDLIAESDLDDPYIVIGEKFYFKEIGKDLEIIAISHTEDGDRRYFLDYVSKVIEGSNNEIISEQYKTAYDKYVQELEERNQNKIQTVTPCKPDLSPKKWWQFWL